MSVVKFSKIEIYFKIQCICIISLRLKCITFVEIN